jgi:protein-disulfide isomerase
MSIAVAAAPSSAQEPGGAKPEGAVLAEVNGAPITAEEVDGAIGVPVRKLQEQIYSLRRQKLETMISDKLLAEAASRRGVTVPALLDAEVTKKVSLVTEVEIAKYLETNKVPKGPEEDDAAVNEKVRARLQSQQLAEQRSRFLQSLRSQARVAVLLAAPPVARVEVSVADAPVRGPATAPVTIIEFSDYHCPFCKRVEPTLKQLLEKYPGKVRLAYRDFPLDSLHPQARKASEAARCAGDQKRYWEFHDALYAGDANASAPTLRTMAEQVGLDVAAFERCVVAGTHQEAVQKDVEEGRRAGVTGTPAFFVNGRFLSGAQPLEAFSALVDEELSRAASR